MVLNTDAICFRIIMLLQKTLLLMSRSVKLSITSNLLSTSTYVNGAVLLET